MEAQRVRKDMPLELGRILITPGALEVVTTFISSVLMARHKAGDWGELCEEDRQANEQALIHGLRVMSVYIVAEQKVWIITEADRSATTILLPEEY